MCVTSDLRRMPIRLLPEGSVERLPVVVIAHRLFDGWLHLPSVVERVYEVELMWILYHIVVLIRTLVTLYLILEIDVPGSILHDEELLP